MKDKIQGFLESMAGQFHAGFQIIEPLKGHRETNSLWVEAHNQLNRDIDSFLCRSCPLVRPGI